MLCVNHGGRPGEGYLSEGEIKSGHNAELGSEGATCLEARAGPLTFFFFPFPSLFPQGTCTCWRAVLCDQTGGWPEQVWHKRERVLPATQDTTAMLQQTDNTPGVPNPHALIINAV